MAETRRSWSSTTALRWINAASFSLPPSFTRWPRLFASYFTPTSIRGSSATGAAASGLWSSLAAVNYVDISVSFVDSVVWSLISAVESVAVVSMLCFFLVSYGCTI